MSYQNINRTAFRMTSAFFGSRIAVWLLVFWSFAEASVWFLGPDLLLMPFCAMTDKSRKKLIGITILSSLIGGVLYYLLCRSFPMETYVVLQSTPFVQDRMIELIRFLYADYGAYGSLLQSVTLYPFKIWTYLAAESALNPLLYFPAVAVSRLFRFTVVTVIARWVFLRFKTTFEKHFIGLVSTYLIVFFALMFVIEG